MSDQGFKKQRDLKLHCQMYHPPPKVPELVLDTPSLAYDSQPKRVTIEYAPGLERAFTPHLLHQFRSESMCTCIAISRNERYFAVGGNRTIHICSVESGDEVMRLDTNVPGPIQQDSEEYVRDLLFTADSEVLIGATDKGRIMVCCQAWTSWLGTHVCQKS